MDKLPMVTDSHYFLAKGGEMGRLMRAKDWTKTSLGSPEVWPQSLKTMVAAMLENPFATYIAWGDDFIQLYNDGYRPILGSTKHPQALGISTRETFSEIWHIIEAMFSGVMEGKAVGFPDFMLPLNRNGYTEECYFDFAYSPIRKENGDVGGVLVTVIETTGKKQSEIALKESEEKFRTMADNIPNLAWMADASGNIFWYNKKWYDYTGTTPDQMAGWGWQSVHDPEKLPIVLSKWRDSIASGRPFEMVFPIKSASNHFRQFLTRVLPVYDSKSKISQWFGTNTDITERIEAEQALQESEERFKTMAEGTDFLIAVANENGKAVFFNKAWTHFTGRGIEKLLDFGWTDLIHPADKEHFVQDYKLSLRVQKGFSGEFRIKHNNGHYRWLLAKGPARYRPDGSFAGHISSCVDITDQVLLRKSLEENEQNLRSMILQAPVAMCIFKGQNHVVELANQRMYELWGKSSEVMQNRPFFEGLPEAKDQGFEAILDGVHKSGKRYSAQALPITLPRNEKIELVYMNFVYEPYREPNGLMSGILAVAVDVTAEVIARHKIEEVVEERTKALKHSNINLEKSNAELAQFAYIASHDLQEPVRKISTFAHLLEDHLKERIDDVTKNYIAKIYRSSSRMQTLIRDILSYSKLVWETGAFESVDLNTIVKAVLVDYDLMIEEKKATIDLGNLPTIQAIAVHMSQLFSNILSNALKFSRKEAGLRIRINCQKLSKEHLSSLALNNDLSFYLIKISDNGIGIEPEFQKKIFEIFKRLHRAAEFEGTGIGLAICTKIVQAHHGEINAEGSTADGAVFNIFLPATQPGSRI